jgi:hypothetical protein
VKGDGFERVVVATRERVTREKPESGREEERCVKEEISDEEQEGGYGENEAAGRRNTHSLTHHQTHAA